MEILFETAHGYNLFRYENRFETRQHIFHFLFEVRGNNLLFIDFFRDI